MSKFSIILFASLFCFTNWGWAEEGYNVQLKEYPTQTVVCASAEATTDQMDQEKERLFDEIFQYLGNQQTTSTGPALAIFYYRQASDKIPLEACTPVPENISGSDKIVAKKLPGGTMASVMHIGPYDSKIHAYEALVNWMTKEGCKEAGPYREVYLKKIPFDYKTEILLPITCSEEIPDN